MPWHWTHQVSSVGHSATRAEAKHATHRGRPVTPARAARIASVGSAPPARVVPNAYFESLGIGTSDRWIAERTGIHERRFAGPSETTSSLAADAGRACLEAAAVD